MLIRDLFPFGTPQEAKKPAVINPDNVNMSKVFKIRTLGTSFNTSFSLFSSQGGKNRANFEFPPYNLNRITQAIDTDSYLKQGFWKYRELFWKEGWDIISEDPAAVEYLWKRIDLFEEVMGRPFNDFLVEVVDQLVKLGNAFVVESRGNIAPLFPDTLKPKKGLFPISGYYLIPTEATRIYRDQYNNPIQYKQAINDQEISTYNNDITEPVWDANEIIHFFLDRKPGRAFGTPFALTALDDVIALRQLEEDVQNLVHRELSPIYQYRVGTETMPASPEELEEAANTIADMRVEGGLIIPERHEITVIGSEGKAMDANEYLSKFTTRVITGLGLAPHHLGIMSDGGNRSVTDRLDIALYDKIKSIQAYVEGIIRLRIFNPLLREGGFDPLVQPVSSGSSPRCYMKFREIDIDTQVKIQTHYINEFANNAISLEELRTKLGYKPDVDMSQLLMTLTAKVGAAAQVMVATNSPRPPVTATGVQGGTKVLQPGHSPAPQKPDAIHPSTGGAANQPNAKKGPGNVIKPSNQFGRSTSPNIRHDDMNNINESQLNDIVALIGDDDE